MPRTTTRSSTAIRVLGYAASIAVVAWLLVGVLPEVGDVEEAGDLLRERIDATDVSLIVVLLVAHVATHGLTLVVAVRGLPLGAAVWLRLVSGGVGRVLPAGWALGTGLLGAMLRRRGVALQTVGHAIAVTGVWNLLTKLALPAVGAVAVALWGTTAEPGEWGLFVLAVAAVAVTVLLVQLLLRERVGRWGARLAERALESLDRWFGRDRTWELSERVVDFQTSTAEALRERPAPMSGAFFSHHLTHAALLWGGLAAVSDPGGLVVGGAEVLAVFSLGYLLTGLPISPGGLGTLDVVVVAGLVAAGEDPGVVTAGVAVYRVATYAAYLPGVVAAWPLMHRFARERATSAS